MTVAASLYGRIGLEPGNAYLVSTLDNWTIEGTLSDVGFSGMAIETLTITHPVLGETMIRWAAVRSFKRAGL